MSDKRKSRAGQRQYPQFPLHFLASALACAALTAAFLALFAKAMASTQIPLELIAPMSTAACCLALLPSGILFAFLRGEKGLLNGLLLATVFLAVLWGAALAQGQAAFTYFAALKSLVLLACGAVGGYVGVLLREKRRRIH